MENAVALGVDFQHLFALRRIGLDGSGKGSGGEGGIRTPDTVARMPHFECGAFNHSATSPGAVEAARGRASVVRAAQ